MPRTALRPDLLLVVCLLLAPWLSGCRNQCGSCLPRPFAMSPRIPAPGTYAWVQPAPLPPQHQLGQWSSTTLSQSNANGPQPTGTSFVVSPAFNTTSVDPRLDPSRLAVSDASQVAAPAALGIAPHAGPMAQALYRGQVPPGTTPFNVRQGTFEYLGGGQVANMGNTIYSAGAPQQIVQPRPYMAHGTPVPSTPSPNSQNGWRNAAPANIAPSLNR